MKTLPDSQVKTENPKTAPVTRKKGFPFVWLILLTVIVAAAFVYVTSQRAKAEESVKKMTQELAIPSVQVVNPTTTKNEGEIVLPGNVNPYADTPIFARTNGYVKRWLVDIGSQVKQGDLLVELEAPELDQQIRQAEGLVAQAQAKLDLAQSSDKRWKELLADKAVSQQEADEKAGDLATGEADLKAQQANLARLKQLKAFQQITSPFDGRVTVRNVQVGDLITAEGGTSGARSELYRITQDNILRIYVNVPENYAGKIQAGQTAKIDLAFLPGVKVEGNVVRTSGTIDQQSRTMLAEVQVNNDNHEYLAGGYATVHFALPSSASATVLPVNTLLFRPDGTLVGVVNSENGGDTVQLKRIKIGRDLGTNVEVVSGLDPHDRIILNPSDSLQNGDKVRVIESTGQPQKT